MLTDPAFFAVAIPAVILVGLAKGGFLSGLAVLGVPLLSLAIPPVQAAGILLPILIAMDAVGVLAYRKSFDARNLKLLIPAAAVGIAAGYLLAAYVTEGAVRLLVGVIALAFALDYWFRGATDAKARPFNASKGGFWGAIAGFTSFVSHAGSPPVQIFLLPQRLPKIHYAGTMALLFASINLIKVPPYYLLGQFAPTNLSTSLILLPLAPLSMFAGIWLVRHIPQEPFYRIAYICVFVVSLRLIWDGSASLL